MSKVAQRKACADVHWVQVFDVCEPTGGTEWYVVEHEVGDDPMGNVRGCLEGLRKMGRGL